MFGGQSDGIGWTYLCVGKQFVNALTKRRVFSAAAAQKQLCRANGGGDTLRR